MDKIDYKLLNKELYSPKTEPSAINVPAMNFIMVDGYGNPNDEGGEYHQAVELLYALSYTIKMDRKKSPLSKDNNCPDYVVPPLEGLWWLEDENDMDFTQKSKFCWTSMIRQPEFITQELFLQAKEVVSKKKPELDVTKARLETFEEGLCVQCMHLGPYDLEPGTIEKIDHFIKSQGLKYAIGAQLPDGKIRRHHEIYLGDPRKTEPSKMKTVIRHPVCK